MNKELPELDDRCKHILTVLIFKDGKLRFTELYNALKELNIEMKKPTLVKHLDHLQSDKLVTRKEKHKNVTYIVQDNLMKLKPFLDRATEKILQERIAEKIIEVAEDKKNLLSLPVKDQVDEVLRMIAGRDLWSIEAKIKFESDGKIEYGLLSMYLENPFFKRHEEWLREQCHKDKEYRKEVIERIEELLGKFEMK